MNYISDYRTEEFALQASWQDFPDKVKEYAVMCAVDLTTALVLGCCGRQFNAGKKVVDMCGLHGDIPIIGSAATYNLLGAAIALGHASNSFDIDDGHRAIQGHPGASFIAGVLAAACKQNVSLHAVLECLVVCYELSIRWAMVMQREYNYLHSTGAYGAFGTAVGIGRLLGLTRQQLNNALSIADYHAPLTPVMRSVEYPSMNKDGVPFGAMVGTMAVIETLCGSTGKMHLLENADNRNMLEDLGTKWHILDLYFKPYTCCRWAHQPIKAIIDLKSKYNFAIDDVENVKVLTFRSASLLSKKVPEDSEEAQYNIAYPVACALIYGDVGFQQMREEAIPDMNVVNMMKKLRFEVSEEYEALFPSRRLASVAIRLKDGRVLQSGTYNAPGEPEDPALGIDWICEKFEHHTVSTLTPNAQQSIVEAWRYRQEMEIRELIDIVNSSLKKK